MIYLDNVKKRYQNTVAVSDLTLEIGDGEVCVIIGPSGCGKTTTMRMINRLIEPTSGEIYINGENSGGIKAEILRRSIGYAIQSVGLFPHMTVAANISVVPELLQWDKARIEKRIKELLQLVGLNPDEYYAKYPGELSGGEAQRIGVARALAADPPILLMDEPFGAVDPLTREKLQTQFLNIQRELKKTVILVTHDLDEAIRMADRIAIMKSGKLVQYDTPEAILTKPADKFVHDFVGTDRALKRLSRLNVEPYIKSAPFVNIDDSIDDAVLACDQCLWVWVIDKEKRVKGWLYRSALARAASIKEAMVKADADEIAIYSTASLREALSRMLIQGFKDIPVIDKKGHLLGQVGLEDIEKITAENETKHG
jgi:osmoprotectant transport system ATP-binding protein